MCIDPVVDHLPHAMLPAFHLLGVCRKELAEGLRAQVEEQLAAEGPDKAAMPTYGTGVR